MNLIGQDNNVVKIRCHDSPISHGESMSMLWVPQSGQKKERKPINTSPLKGNCIDPMCKHQSFRSSLWVDIEKVNRFILCSDPLLFITMRNNYSSF